MTILLKQQERRRRTKKKFTHTKRLSFVSFFPQQASVHPAINRWLTAPGGEQFVFALRAVNLNSDSSSSTRASVYLRGALSVAGRQMFRSLRPTIVSARANGNAAEISAAQARCERQRGQNVYHHKSAGPRAMGESSWVVHSGRMLMAWLTQPPVMHFSPCEIFCLSPKPWDVFAGWHAGFVNAKVFCCRKEE